MISTKHAPHRPVSVYWKFQCWFPPVWHKTWLHIVAQNCALPFPWHTHKNCFTKNALKLAWWHWRVETHTRSLWDLPTLHVKGKPAVLPDRAICRQSPYFICRPHIQYLHFSKTAVPKDKPVLVHAVRLVVSLMPELLYWLGNSRLYPLTGWASEPVQTLWWTEKSLVPVGIPLSNKLSQKAKQNTGCFSQFWLNDTR